MEAAHVTGVGIAVWNDGKIVYLKTYGRGRDGSCPPPPAQIRTCSITASALAYGVTHETAAPGNRAACVDTARSEWRAD